MAAQLYISIEGAKQGKIKGESGDKPGKSPLISAAFEVHAFQHGVISPRDPATGMASGKRQHQPVTIVKNWGATSPQLFQAMLNNETLQVVIEWTDGGKGPAYRAVRLSNATIVSIRKQGKPNAGRHGMSVSTHELEEIKFTFQKIEMDNKGNKTSYSDDWTH